jgi:hypothetical protein
VATIHHTTLVPSKMELLAGWLPSRRWYRGTGRSPELMKAGGFRLDDPEGAVGIEFMVAADVSGTIDGQPTVYHVPLTYRPGPLDGADDGLIGTAEHGVLGRRWIYDGASDPVLVTQLLALIQGAAEPQSQNMTDTPDPTVVSRPAADGAGQLDLAVRRVLTPLAVLRVPEHGYVTATWQLPDGSEARGVFATATASIG